jgi:hypothetical protein
MRSSSAQRLLEITAIALVAACGASGGAPAVTISSPMPNQMVTAAADKSIPIAFALTNFVLMPAGTAGCNAGCGHIHVLVDGSACTPTGDPYNNDASSSPAKALLAKCPTATGSHTATLELHNNDHSALNDASGKVISTSVTFTAM